MERASTAVEVFCAYARADEAWRKKLETHLSVLKQQGLISLWHHRLILPGMHWAKAIDAHLETASVVLLLVSASFLASHYCSGIEMKRALERQEAGEARVLPILVRPVDWTGAPFAHLQILPADAKPLSTWKNKDTALADITAGIRRVVVEELPFLTASAPRAALPKIWNVPYPRNPFFLGRDEELAHTRQQLQAGQATALSQPQAISGLGGIGKTQLALEYAYRYHQDYTAVLWARAESTEALVSSYVTLATLLNLPEREAKEQEIIVQAVKTWLQDHRAWLLILDNADDLKLLPDFLSPSLGGHLLLTTRATAIGRLANRLEIETLEPSQGALFLLRRAGLIAPDAALSQVSSQGQELALQISQELGGLPLALDQAGAYLEETGTDLGTYWQIYQQHRADLLRERGGLVADHPAPVATTWSLSIQQAQKKKPAAAELLCLCTFLAPDAIPEEILAAGASSLGPALAPVAADPFRLNQVLEALRAYSLIQRNPTRKLLSIHRLVQAVLQDTLEEEVQHIWRERAMLAVNAAFPVAEFTTWAQCERMLSQALFTTQSVERNQLGGEEAGRLLSETACYLQDRARYVEAEPLYQRALQIWEQQLGTDHSQVASSLDGLADLYYQQGKYVEAEPLYQRALQIREQQLGPDHSQVASSLNHLANLYAEQGKYVEAEPLYRRALQINEQQLGPDHPHMAKLLHGLATLYCEQGRYTEAEPLYQRALRICEQQLGPEHPNTAYPLHNLANLYLDQRRYVEAEPLYQRTLQIREQQLGLEHPQVAHVLDNLANLYREQGRYTEAEPLYQRALQIQEQQLGPEHYQVAHVLNDLASLYDKQGKYVEAEPLYRRALQINEQQSGPDHPDTAEILHAFAAFRELQGNLQEAQALYQRAYAIREQMLGETHPKTQATRQRLNALEQSIDQEGVASPQDDLSAEQSDGNQ